MGNSNFLSKVSQIWLKSRFISVFLIFFQTFSKNRFKHVRICRILWRSRFFGPNDPKYSPNINFYFFYKKSYFYQFYQKMDLDLLARNRVGQFAAASRLSPEQPGADRRRPADVFP